MISIHAITISLCVFACLVLFFFRLTRLGLLLSVVAAVIFSVDYDRLPPLFKVLYVLAEEVLAVVVGIVVLGTPYMAWLYWRYRYERKGSGLIDEKDYEGAIVTLKKSIEIYGPSLNALATLAMAHCGWKRFDNALATSDQAIELGLIPPVHEMQSIRRRELEFVINRGVYLLELRRFREALTCFEKAMENAQESGFSYIWSLIHYGLAYAEMGEREAALEVLKHVRDWRNSFGMPVVEPRDSIENLLERLNSAIDKLDEPKNQL